jgi:hypothetical protein
MTRGDKAVALGWIAYAVVVGVFVVKASKPKPPARPPSEFDELARAAAKEAGL